MRRIASFTALAFVLLVSRGAWGAPDGPQALPGGPGVAAIEPADPEGALPPEKAPEGPEIEPLKMGAPAPFTGLLVPEARYVELLEAENRVRELEARLAANDRTAALVEAVYLKKLEQATAPIPWYEGATFNRWLGFGLGLAAAGLAVWGATEIVQQTK